MLTYTAIERAAAVARVDLFLREEPSLNRACKKAKVNKGNYLRWKKQPAGAPLMPARERLAKERTEGKPRGRKRRGLPNAAEWELLFWLAAETGSFALAVEYFVRYGRTGQCLLPCPQPPPRREVADVHGRGMERGSAWARNLPKWLRQGVARSLTECAARRGEKQYNDIALSVPRGMFYYDFDRDGIRQKILLAAGMGWSIDDVSFEQPFVSATAEGERVNRQSLAIRDIFSGKWIALLCLAREGDAYTKVDQADVLAAAVRAAGLPRFVQFERGPWENDFINGVRVKDKWDSPVERWGGLGALFHVDRKFKPQGKHIEGGLRYLQSRLNGRALSVGSRSSRVENEHATRIVSAAQRGNAGALRRLWNIADGADGFWQAMGEDNARAKEREFLDGAAVSPDDLWAESFAPVSLPDAEAWRLLPVKLCRQVVKQRVKVVLPGYGRFYFRTADPSLPILDPGHRVLLAFHPDRPEEGAHLFNGDVRSRFARGLAFGEFLGKAEPLPIAPVADFTGGADCTPARMARQMVRSELRVYSAGKAGVVRVSRASDGLGQTLHATNDPAYVPEGRPAPQPPRAPRVRSLTDLLPRDESAELPRFSPPVTPDDQPLRHSRIAGRGEATGGELVTTGGDPWAEIS